MSRRAVTFSLILVLVSLAAACIPGVDNGGSVADSGSSEIPLEERASDWFKHKKVEQLPYNPLPPRAQDGTLPRTLGAYTLLGTAPSGGKDFRDGQKIYYVEEQSANRRMRVFSRKGTIFRIQALTRLTELDTTDVAGLMLLIAEQYGPADREIPAEMTYVDQKTVLLFSISTDFLITELMDIATCELPRYISKVVENKRTER